MHSFSKTLSLLLCFSIVPLFSQNLLELLEVIPSQESQDYIETKRQFQLHHLLTEQRHPKTFDLSYIIEKDIKEGLKALFSVDEDISLKCEEGYDIALLEQAASRIEKAILNGNKIYLYGCGATGRLAKQVESSLWRPFWTKLESSASWETLKHYIPSVKEQLIGEMTGGDRALISSLEGFEDLQLIGKLQLEDHGIQKGDVVFAITEGGETSSVIGTILSAASKYKEDENQALENLYFVYNNPDPVLLALDRSREVLENPLITKIRLFTGPQSITGSTRMQATTSETFVMGVILEEAIFQILKRYISLEELKELGLEPLSIQERLASFISLQKAVASSVDALSELTELEAATYLSQGFSTYFARKALIPVFTDATERAPTFRLFPLDTCQTIERKSLIQVWTNVSSLEEAWLSFLGRPFKGLSKKVYQAPFSFEIQDPYLKKAALSSLERAGNEQQYLYDFSFSKNNQEKKGPKKGDLALFVLIEEEIDQLFLFEEPFKHFAEEGASIGVIAVSQNPISKKFYEKLDALAPTAKIVPLEIGKQVDPLSLRSQIALKMLLNAHSTAIMTKLGKVVGNTMTNVNPGNLKLIGRATYLTQMHINSFLKEEDKLSYPETNALLFDAIHSLKIRKKEGLYSEVGLSIIRALESYRQKKNISWEESEKLFEEKGLSGYLQNFKN